MLPSNRAFATQMLTKTATANQSRLNSPVAGGGCACAATWNQVCITALQYAAGAQWHLTMCIISQSPQINNGIFTNRPAIFTDCSPNICEENHNVFMPGRPIAAILRELN